MFEVNTTPYFIKKVNKLVNKNIKLAEKIDKTIQSLAKDPRDSTLKSHKVIIHNLGEVFSSRVTGDIRILWDYSDSNINIIDLLDIGGHSGNTSVY